MRISSPRTGGSVLAWTVLIIAILSLVGAQVMRVVTLKYQNALQTATWQETLVAAESGVDLAIVELRKSIYPQPNGAWDGWTTPTPAPSPAPSATPGTRYGKTTIPNAGLAGTEMTINVNVDAPQQLVEPGSSWQYYRIRATGTMPLTGPARVTDNKQDTSLRRLSLHWERFTNGLLSATSLAAPQVCRRVEAIVRPVSAFDQAIMSVGMLDLNNQNIRIDSYDSTDPLKSTNGLYDLAKFQKNGNIATDGAVIDAGGATIWGSASTNAGTVIDGANVKGIQRTDFYQEPIPISAPSWPSINPTPSTVTGSATLTASATKDSTASRYMLSQISISGGQTLMLAGAPDGSRTYIEIYVTGSMSVAGTSQIVLAAGVSATIYFTGNVAVAGNGMVNTNNQPADLQLYGIQPPTGITQTVSLGGNGQITASVYAPGAAVSVNGGGTNGHVFGSVVGKTMTMTGVTNLHYDEALSKGGTINNYKIVSWFEDNR
ncbi:MAG: hypothetical protein ABI871_01895 [Chthoniobacterales bacterium]